MARSEQWYWAGFAIGVLVGIGLFLAECPWNTCVQPGIELGHHGHPTSHKADF